MPTGDCFERGLKLLGVRPHFRAELERKLAQRGYDASDIDSAIARLSSQGYLNDEEAATSFARARARRRPEGALRLRAELVRRGASPEAIEKSLETRAGESDERDGARLAAERWLARRSIRAEKDRAALARHLGRRGYTSAVIAETLRAFAPRG